MIRHRPAIAIALLLTTALHLALLFAVLKAQPRADLAPMRWQQQAAMTVILLASPVAPARLLPPPIRMASRRPGKAAPAPAVPRPALPAMTKPAAAAPATGRTPDEAPDQTPPRDEFGLAVTTPAPSRAAELMRLARPDVAGIVRDISKELGKDLPARDKTLSSDLQKRLDQRFDEAHASVRPNWYQGARFEEITAAGSDGARLYRVTTAIGSYCIRYSKNGGRPTYATCP